MNPTHVNTNEKCIVSRGLVLSFEALVLNMSCTFYFHLWPLSYTGSYGVLGKRPPISNW